MKDTPPEVENLFRRMIMRRGPLDRLEMGLDMYDAARSIVLASLREAGGEDLPARLFLRFHAGDFGPEQRERIVARIREYHRDSRCESEERADGAGEVVTQAGPVAARGPGRGVEDK